MVVIKQRQIRVNGLAGDTVYNRKSGGSLDESKRGSSGGLDDRQDQTPLRIILNRCEYSKFLKALLYYALFHLGFCNFSRVFTCVFDTNMLVSKCK